MTSNKFDLIKKFSKFINYFKKSSFYLKKLDNLKFKFTKI